VLIVEGIRIERSYATGQYSHRVETATITILARGFFEKIIEALEADSMPVLVLIRSAVRIVMRPLDHLDLGFDRLGSISRRPNACE